MGRIATAGVPVLVEHRSIRIQTTRLSRAAFPLREGPRGKPATQRAWAHAHLPGDPRHRQPLLPQGTGLLILAQALGPTELPRGFCPPSRRSIRINGAWVSRA